MPPTGASRDVVFRFTGTNDLGPIATAVKRELDSVITHYQKVNRMTSQMVSDRLVSARKFKEEINAINRFAQQQGPRGMTTAQVASRAVGKRDAWMQPFLNPDEGARGWVRYGSAAEGAFIQAERGAKRFASTAKKAFAGLGMAWAFGGDMVTGQGAGGRSPAMAGLGAGASIGGAAGMGAMFGGGPGAMVMGGIETIRQVAGAREKAAVAEKEAAKAQHEVIKDIHALSDQRILRNRAFADAIAPDPKRNPAWTLRGGAAHLSAQADAMNKAMGDLFKAPTTAQSLVQIETLGQQRDDARREARRLIGLSQGQEGQRRSLQFLSLLGGNIQARAQTVGGLFSGLGVLGRAGGGLTDFFTRNRAMRLENEFPAEKLRRELGFLDAQRRQGLISPERFGRARQGLFLGAIGGLSGPTPTPGLQATEGRFLTRGRDKAVDELSALRREARQHAKRNEDALKLLLIELQGAGAGNADLG